MSEKDSNDHDFSETLEQAGYSDDSIHSIHSAQLHREQEEPTEGMSPVPMFIIFLFSVCMFWSGMYLNEYSGDFRGDVFDHNWTPGASEKVEKPFEPLVEGKKIFARNCQQCHQGDGMGLPGVYPPLVNSEWVLGDDVRIAKLLLGGMSGTITVLGKDYTGQMPNFADWKDRNIAAVLSYIRQEWGNDAPAVEVDTVSAAREEMGPRSKPWKPKELLEIHPF